MAPAIRKGSFFLSGPINDNTERLAGQRNGSATRQADQQKCMEPSRQFLYFRGMKFHCCSVALLSLTLVARGEAQAPVPLWPDGAPGALGMEDKDIPTLTLFLADSATASGAAMVILPGGGYGGLAAHEGKGYADWLVTNGISCFVLKYRLGGSQGYRHPRMLEDAAKPV